MRKLLNPIGLFLAAIASMFAAPAFAALDAGVETALTTAKTDVGALGVLVFGIVVVIAVFKWFRRSV